MPYPDNSPGGQFPTVQVLVLMSGFIRGSGLSGELSWWGIVLGIVVLVGNGWALLLSGGELSSWGVVLEPPYAYAVIISLHPHLEDTVKPRLEAHMDIWSFVKCFEEHRLDSTTTDITTALFIL